MPKIIKDECSCGEKISVEIDSPSASRTDGKRPFYPDEKLPCGLDPKKYSVSVFRCRNCLSPVGETVPSAKYSK